jgi:choline kinase
MKHNANKNERVRTALLLAAGTGSRLHPLTQNAPKCMTIVNGRSILEQLVISLNLHGFNRLVIVTGYMEQHIKDVLGDRVGGVKIDYVFSSLYDATNNIYSLWMARKVVNEPFLLLESDLVFDVSLLTTMLHPDKIAVAKMQPWMSGTFVTIDKNKRVKAFHVGSEASVDEIKYKTVNIYSISLTLWHRIVKQLDKHISDGSVQEFYEVVFAEMVSEGTLSFDAVSFEGMPWLEIDTIEDLEKAKIIMSGRNTTQTILSSSHPGSLNIGSEQ